MRVNTTPTREGSLSRVTIVVARLLVSANRVDSVATVSRANGYVGSLEAIDDVRFRSALLADVCSQLEFLERTCVRL